MQSFYKFCYNNNIGLETTSNYDLINYAKQLNINNFRGYFMNDELQKQIRTKEYGIVNLENSDLQGSHHVCYYKKGKEIYYFDSYGLLPTNELKSYLKGKNREIG